MWLFARPRPGTASGEKGLPRWIAHGLERNKAAKAASPRHAGQGKTVSKYSWGCKIKFLEKIY
jgi:hypothetical protein